MGAFLVRARRLCATAAAIAMAFGSMSVVAAPDDAVAAGCARQFDLAQRADMESFRDFDVETFRAVHHPQAVTVFASGAVRYGIDAIMATLASHFANRQAVWAWTELYRVVDGCSTAFILYDTTYDIPAAGVHQHALIGVTYTRVGNKWLAMADQGTPLR